MKVWTCNVERVVSGGTGLIFKGSGFYLTDYKNSNQKKDKKNKTDSKTDKKSTKKTDSKKTGKKNS
ncbi:MAG: hypothetical protein CM15mP87_05300 [Candidatus Neomarinimicrobiota bacterium]|nr:MAG: hypothetical protein CM15mP87_05300 [Candidatus Neomarinimicrobiota bacterium]